LLKDILCRLYLELIYDYGALNDTIMEIVIYVRICHFISSRLERYLFVIEK